MNDVQQALETQEKDQDEEGFEQKRDKIQQNPQDLEIRISQLTDSHNSVREKLEHENQNLIDLVYNLQDQLEKVQKELTQKLEEPPVVDQTHLKMLIQ